MEWTAEAIKAIQQPAIEAESLKKSVSIVDTPDPRKKLLVQAGKHEDFIVPPPPRTHHVFSLADLIAYAAGQPKPVVWHSCSGVTLVLDDADRRDVCRFPLVLSDVWKKLQSLDAAPIALSQKDFIRLLRLYLGASEDILTIFRRLDFKVISEGGGTVGKTQESLGRSIVAEVRGTSDLPDDLVFEVPIYDNCGERQKFAVRLLLEYDSQNQRIMVTPEPGLLAELEVCHQADIHERLTSALAGDKDHAAVPVYFGTP